MPIEVFHTLLFAAFVVAWAVVGQMAVGPNG